MSDEEVAVDRDEAVAEAGEELSEQEQAMAKLKEAISVEREDIGPLRLKLTVTIPTETLDERRGDQFAELKRDALVPGFRKGHAPLRLVEKRFASDVGERLKSELFSSGYLAAVEKEDLKPLGDPLFWVKVKEERTGEDDKPRQVETEKLLPIERALESLKLPKEGPLRFSCELELKPDFELPKLDKIPVQRPTVSIGDEDVEEELQRMCKMRGAFQPVEDGSVELDDMLYADMKMLVDSETISTEDNFGLAARDIFVKGVALKGLGEAATGKKLGETISIEAEVPDDHENIDARGKTARFEFVLREIKRLEVPPMSEVLPSLGFDDEDELRKAIRSSLEARLDSTIKDAMHGQVGQYLLDNTKLDIPEGLSQRQTERSVARRMIEMYQAGVPEAEIEKQMDELRAGAHDQVLRDLKLFFILEKVAEERDIDVSEEQVNGAIAQMAQRSNKRFDRVRDELSKGAGLTMLYHKLRDHQTLEALLADAEVSDTEGPKKIIETTAKAKKKTPAEKTTKTKAAKKKVSKRSS